jgi:hypothetical protein
MSNLPKKLSILLLVLVTPMLLGAEGCEDEGLLARIVRGAVEELGELDDRVSYLEECACEGILEPVCADTGDTYVNACEARCARVQIVASGECPEVVCGGTSGQSCDSGYFCELPAGCDDTLMGRCRVQPDICTFDYAPVCGCNGEVYGNNCERRSAAEQLDHRGVCNDPPVVCSENGHCDSDSFCHKRPDSCDERGTCQLRPTACTDDYTPVCGCDGVTHSNRCEALAAGTSIAHRGECKEPPVVCGDNDDCDESSFCLKRPGSCEARGICQVRPMVCTREYEPVCGCDGETHSNRCEAAGSGVSMDERGECEEEKDYVCHLPGGDWNKRHTLYIGVSAIPAHLGHGDVEGKCPEREDDLDDEDGDDRDD